MPGRTPPPLRWGYDERRPGTLWAYYRALIEREPDPQRRAAAKAPTRLCASCATNPEGPPVPRTGAAHAPLEPHRD